MRVNHLLAWLLLALFWSFPAAAQNPTCPTRPLGDSTNACASTAFVNQFGTGSTTGTTIPFLPVIGNSTGNGFAQGTRSGSTTAYATVTGALTNGHCVSIDSGGNLIDAGAACATGTGSGTVNAGVQGQIAGYAANGAAVVGLPTCTPIETFGGGTSLSDNASALNTALSSAAWSNSAKGGVCILFGPGTYIFLSQIDYTFPGADTYRLDLVGTGRDNTILYWPSTDALHLTEASSNNSFGLRNLSITTGTTIRSALVLQGATGGVTKQSDIDNVSFIGQDGGATNTWAFGIFDTSLSVINLNGVYFVGPSGAASGVAFHAEGIVSLNAVQLNFTNSTFFNLLVGLDIGSYTQGFQISTLNCVIVGSCIHVPASETGIDQLAISASQFNASGQDIFIQSAVADVSITSSLFFINNGNTGFWCQTCQTATVVGNVFSGTTGGNGVIIDHVAVNTGATVVGNQFKNLTTGVDLTVNANSAVVSSNIYNNVSNHVINSGATACPASASGNCVGTATP